MCFPSGFTHVLVADLNLIHYFTPSGIQEEVWPPDVGRRGKAEFLGISGMCLDQSDNLVIADNRKTPVVGTYSQDTGRPIHQFKLKSGQEFKEPSYIACNRRTGLIYVSDSIKGCVYSFDKHGKHVNTFGNNPKGHLICPLGLDVSCDDKIFVADKGAHCISVYSMDGGSGSFMYNAVDAGQGVQDPIAVAVNADGSLSLAQQSYDYGCDSNSVKFFKRMVK